jgi:hypothetical protein
MRARADVDFCVTLGGDGTVLHLAGLFSADAPLPPLVSFAMGTLGFLTPFDAAHYQAHPFLSCLSAHDYFSSFPGRSVQEPAYSCMEGWRCHPSYMRAPIGLVHLLVSILQPCGVPVVAQRFRTNAEGRFATCCRSAWRAC